MLPRIVTATLHKKRKARSHSVLDSDPFSNALTSYNTKLMWKTEAHPRTMQIQLAQKCQLPRPGLHGNNSSCHQHHCRGVGK